MQPADNRVFRVLILCTGNSARTQIAEAIFNWRDGAASWPKARARGRLERRQWDFVITECDKAKESSPLFSGQPILAHWEMPDPAAVEGDDDPGPDSGNWRNGPGGLA